ncbi:MAG TPA: sigma-54 dependent transcriptional regulator [Verrucomicrobiota bacterium]|nr:sigma-54 dependent transcriptional regulator [Verrucomicrobiota bacterium]
MNSSQKPRCEIPGRVLVVDDDPAVLALLSRILEEASFEVSRGTSAADLRRAIDGLDGETPDVVLLDWHLPDADGIQLLPLIKKRWATTEVIVLTGFGTFDAAVEATKMGAFHFQSKPIDPASLLILVQRAAEHRHLQYQTQQLGRVVSTLTGAPAPVFRSPAMRVVLRMVERVAPSPASILIAGESGTGKEVIADLIHSLSPRSRGPLVKVNCAALPRELIESELFGSVKGAYTGAHADRDGLFRQAQGGTLFLDELAEMPAETQSKLLRVLQEKQVRPVGGRTSRPTDCRILAATNLDVDAAIASHKLRGDLYFRVATVRLDLPPLRERREDILPLAQTFLSRFAAQAGRSVTGFTQGAMDRLLACHWPGNVRQLENEVQRAVLVCDGSQIDTQDLSIGSLSQDASERLTALEDVERQKIEEVLRETRGNKLLAARRLGIGRQTLYNKIKRYQLEVDR